MSLENLNSINPQTYPIPEIPQALGELVAELVGSNPDAIVIDRSSMQVIVYPQGSASDRPELTESSITSLLNEYIVDMLGDEIDDPRKLLSAEDSDSHLALFCHPSKKEHIECLTKIRLLTTKVLSPNFLLLCCQGKSEKYLLRGAILKN